MSDSMDIAGQWERDGFVNGIPILEVAETTEIRSAFDNLEQREGPERCQIGLIDRHLDEQFVWSLATHPKVLDAVEAVMGPDILLLATHFFCKYPAASGVPGPPAAWADRGTVTAVEAEATPTPRFVAWHQDVTYWGLEPPFALTAWYAVDDSDVENGCMRVIPGTHDAIREHGKSEREGNLLSINQEVPVTGAEEASAVDLCLRAGQISLHHGALIHGSNPNTSGRRRCGLTIRYVPPHVRPIEANSLRRPWKAVLVRGTDPSGNFGRTRAPFPQVT